MFRPVGTSDLYQRSHPTTSSSHRDSEFERQFHSFGFRHLCGDLLQEVEALIRKRVSPPANLGVA
jgi:hypothetical protein